MMKNAIGGIGCVIFIVGNILTYFLKDYLHVDTQITNELYFYSICAGVAGIAYYATGRNEVVDYLLRALIVYSLYCMIIFSFDFFRTKWMYLMLGGLGICLLRSLPRYLRSTG